MTDWQGVIDDEFRLPPGLSRAAAVAELSDALCSPDPVLRDEQAYPVLIQLIGQQESAERRRLGDAMAARLADQRIQARTFAALILAALVRRGDLETGWLDSFSRWYPAETDLRGYDPQLGWLHAVAHGADLLGALGRHPRVEPAPLLELAARRLLAPTDYLFAHQEDDRLGYAVALVLTRPELAEAQALAWLEPIEADFSAGAPGPVPAYASNTMRTLRMLYLLADRGVRAEPGQPPARLTHREALLQRLAGVLAIVAPGQG
jgi:hypothetical protein